MIARRWQQEFLTSSDPEGTLLEHLAVLGQQAEPPDARWRPGARLKLLLAGYSGAGNVGADMRTGEILRQLRHLLGDSALDVSAFSLGPALPADVFGGVACLPLGHAYLPEMVLSATRNHHATIACEGSMFKSTFANVLSGMMAASLGMAARSGKLSVGYGAEIGTMEPCLEAFVKRQAADSLILCRSQPSLARARALGLRADAGTDTAWAVQAAPRSNGEALMRTAGWNGHEPVLVICPMNPFWWPVRPSPRMARDLRRSGAHSELHFGSVFFHASSPQIEGRYRAYLSELAAAIAGLCQMMRAFPVLLAMDRVDIRACHDLATLLRHRGQPIVGADHAVADVVAALRCCNFLVSSRYHALVAALPAGVPSVGIAMDERIHNLFGDIGESERVLAADDPDLGRHVIAVAMQMDREKVVRSARRVVGEALNEMAKMGMQLVEEFARQLPSFPMPARASHWQDYLAPIPPDVEAFAAGGA